MSKTKKNKENKKTIVKKVAKKTNKKTTKKVAKKVTKKITKKVAKKVAKKKVLTKKATKKKSLTKKVAKKTNKKTTKKVAKKVTKKITKKVAKKATKKKSLTKKATKKKSLAKKVSKKTTKKKSLSKKVDKKELGHATILENNSIEEETNLNITPLEKIEKILEYEIIEESLDPQKNQYSSVESRFSNSSGSVESNTPKLIDEYNLDDEFDDNNEISNQFNWGPQEHQFENITADNRSFDEYDEDEKYALGLNNKKNKKKESDEY